MDLFFLNFNLSECRYHNLLGLEFFIIDVDRIWNCEHNFWIVFVLNDFNLFFNYSWCIFH